MDNIKKKLNKYKLKSFDAYINKYNHFSNYIENKEPKVIKQHIGKKIYSNDSTNYNKSIKNSKLNYYENNVFFKNVENLILICLINFILLNINGILCESYIIIKINKSGKYKILFNGGGEDLPNPCKEISSKHTPTSMTINGEQIAPFVGEYEFIQQKNSIKLYYNDLKEDYKCLFYGCSDIDEIDASHLRTSNVINMEYMFCQCNSLAF